MKFGKYLKKQKVPEWTEAYVDYDGLKRILQEIRSSKQNDPNTVTGPRVRLSPFRDFSDTARRDRGLENQEDIENQVIVVHTVQQENCRELYNTKLLVSPEEGEENDGKFFRKLDDELNKANNFYRDIVEEITREAASLEKQMDALMALRIKVINHDFAGTSCLKCLPADIHNLAPSSCIPPDTAENVGIRKMDGKLGVERKCKNQMEPESSTESSLNCREKQSDSHSRCDTLPMETSSCISIDQENANECETAPLEILDRVKILNTFDTPISTIKGVLKDSKEKDLSYNKDELKEVEERLKVAFVEFYQKLCLLKHYGFMNLSAFSKILKKYEKITSKRVARSYMKIVESSSIGSSDEITRLMERVEVVFVKNLLNFNRQEGMKLLRPKQKRENHSVTFFSGFFSGCSVALIVAVILLIEGRKLMHTKDASIYMDVIFPLYSFYIYIVLHMLVYAASIYFWRRCKINYPFIFGLQQGTELGYREIFLLSNGLAVIALATFLIHLHIKMDSKSQRYETYVELLPLGLLIVFLAITFCPFKFIYRSSRFFLIKCMFRCICAPLYKVTFPDFFLADQLTSQIQAIRSFEYYICFYRWGQLYQGFNRCSSHDVYNVFYIFIAVIPYWLRFLQCGRRLFGEGDVSQGYNGLRYFWTIVAVVIRAAFQLRKRTAWKVLASLSSAIATVANTYWDIVVDWGLLQRKSKNLFLREKLMVSNKIVYFAAMGLDVLLRFAWLQLVLKFDVPSLQGPTISAVFSCLEILRRGLWNFFRLENEHLNNVGRYRAFKSVPLPFTYYEDEDTADDGDDMDKNG